MQDYLSGKLATMPLAQNCYRGRTYVEGKKIAWRDGLVALYSIARFRLFD